MAKQVYVENADEAWCSECTFRCNPSPEEDSRFNTFYLSDCCSADIVDGEGRAWEADVQEGNPEP